MIIIVSTCKYKLSEHEFVRPLHNIASKYGKVEVVHCSKLNERKAERASAIIISGTALKDFSYMQHLQNFGFLKQYNKPVLGICAGMQILAKIYGIQMKDTLKIGKLAVEFKKSEITEKGKRYAYFLTQKEIANTKKANCIASAQHSICGFKLNNVYGFAFHPEVLNKEIIEKFIRLSLREQKQNSPGHSLC